MCIRFHLCHPERAERADELGVTPYLTMTSMAGESRQRSCIILFLVFCSLSCRARAVCNANDSKALLSFKSQLLDPNGELASWVPDSINCCLWKVHNLPVCL